MHYIRMYTLIIVINISKNINQSSTLDLLRHTRRSNNLYIVLIANSNHFSFCTCHAMKYIQIYYVQYTVHDFGV